MDAERGPNADLTIVQQLLAAARAISCFEVDGFEAWYFAMDSMRDQHFPDGTWHRMVHADGHEWFWFVDAQGQVGRSQDVLPPGERLGRTLEVPAGARPAREFLDLGCQMLEAGLVPDGVLPTEHEWRDLTWARDSARTDWPEECTRDVLTRRRAELRESPQRIAELPRRLVEDDWHDLQLLRSRYSADLTLTVGLGWTIRLIVAALQSAELSPEHKGTVLEPWLVEDEFRPMELLAHTASRLLDVGQQGMLATIIDQDRAAAEDLVGRAVAASSLDEHLSLLYTALPQSFSSLAFAKFLASYGEDGQRPKFRKLAKLLDERLVRQVQPFLGQLLDIRGSGAEWVRHRRIVELRHELDGSEAAGQTIAELSAHLLLYPTAVAAQLSPAHDS